MLWALGYSFDPEAERWEQASDKAARMITDIATAIGWAEKGEGWEANFRNWLLRYLETGEHPPFERLQGSFDDEDYAVYKPSPGERLDSFLSRLRHRR